MYKILAIGLVLANSVSSLQLTHTTDANLQKVNQIFDICNLNRNHKLQAGEQYFCYKQNYGLTEDPQVTFESSQVSKTQLYKQLLIQEELNKNS